MKKYIKPVATFILAEMDLSLLELSSLHSRDSADPDYDVLTKERQEDELNRFQEEYEIMTILESIESKENKYLW